MDSGVVPALDKAVLQVLQRIGYRQRPGMIRTHDRSLAALAQCAMPIVIQESGCGSPRQSRPSSVNW